MNEAFGLKEVIAKITEKRPIYLSVIKTANPDISTEVAEDIFSSELENFKNRVVTYANEEVSEGRVMPSLSVLQGTNIFIEVLSLGLSFSESADLVYISRLKGSGTSIAWTTTVRGEIFLSIRSGAIRHVTDPVIVWVGDNFSITTSDCGTKNEVLHTQKQRPRDTPFTFESNFLAGYCWVVYADGSRELTFIDFPRMQEFRKLSSKPKNYDSISMLQSKIVKRALRLVNKNIRLGIQLPVLFDSDVNNAEQIIKQPQIIRKDEPAQAFDATEAPAEIPAANDEAEPKIQEQFNFKF